METWYLVGEEYKKLPYDLPFLPQKSFSPCCIMFTKSPVHALFLPFSDWRFINFKLESEEIQAECSAGAWNWNKTYHPDTNICIRQLFCTHAGVVQKQMLIIGRWG